MTFYLAAQFQWNLDSDYDQLYEEAARCTTGRPGRRDAGTSRPHGQDVGGDSRMLGWGTARFKAAS